MEVLIVTNIQIFPTHCVYVFSIPGLFVRTYLSPCFFSSFSIPDLCLSAHSFVFLYLPLCLSDYLPACLHLSIWIMSSLSSCLSHFFYVYNVYLFPCCIYLSPSLHA